MRSILALFLILSFARSGFAQSTAGDIEAELNSVQGKPQKIPPPQISKSTVVEEDDDEGAEEDDDEEEEEVQAAAPPVKKNKITTLVDEEMAFQDEVLRRKNGGKIELSDDRDQNRFPQPQPTFKLPPGPKQGGTVRIEHPRSAEGLIRINKDGSYQYKTALKEKSKSSSLRLGMMSPPQINGGYDNATITWESMYGSGSIFALNFDYEWQPFRSFGTLGIRVGTGFATATADGYFKNQSRADGRTRSQEKYNIFIVPASAFLTYRFEFVRRQWVVPYVLGGATYYGMAELRNDNKTPSFAGAPAAGGGGGLLLNVSRLDSHNAFTLSEEYGIADMWLTIEAVAMQGLDEEIDFTNQEVRAGIQVDF
jgi:hypothetical protein